MLDKNKKGINEQAIREEIVRLADMIGCYASLVPKQPTTLTQEQLEHKRNFERGAWHF